MNEEENQAFVNLVEDEYPGENAWSGLYQLPKDATNAKDQYNKWQRKGCNSTYRNWFYFFKTLSRTTKGTCATFLANLETKWPALDQIFLVEIR